jgi:hypothetical protein
MQQQRRRLESLHQRQPAVQHQQHGGDINLASDINISSVHLFQRFSTFNSSSVGAQLARQHHQHLRFSLTAAPALSDSATVATVHQLQFQCSASATAALAFGSSDSSGFSVQQQPPWRPASNGSNIFGLSSQRAPCSSFRFSVNGSNSICATTLALNINIRHRSICAAA